MRLHNSSQADESRFIPEQTLSVCLRMTGHARQNVWTLLYLYLDVGVVSLGHLEIHYNTEASHELNE